MLNQPEKNLRKKKTGRSKISPGRRQSAVKPTPRQRDFIRKAYRVLLKAYGPQCWWPAKTPFEVIVGAILTQNTNWGNVEKAIINLRTEGVLTPPAMTALQTDRLAELIRPSGYYNQKAIKLKNFLDYLNSSYAGRISNLKRTPQVELRTELLDISGIGPETADSILLYALGMPAFVIDAYTKRLLVSHEIVDGSADYHDLQAMFVNSLKEDVQVYNEYHALIVRVVKEHYPKNRPFNRSSPLLDL